MTTIIGKCKFIVETKYFLTDFNVLKVKKMKLFKSAISEKKRKKKYQFYKIKIVNIRYTGCKKGA